ncbi:MAG TPA: glucose-6-phosphate isomerase [bacterium]|nr:glucose-6-phosphate isomerase [bacterium]
MPSPLTLDLSYISDLVSEQDIIALTPRVEAALRSLLEGTGRGSDYLGWIDLPFTAKKQLTALKKAAKAFAKCESVVSVGIGGSYLGIKSTIEALGGSDKVHYAGNHLSPTALAKLMKDLDPKKTGIIVISKSGTTTEPAVAFRILKSWVEKAVGKKKAKARIVAVTDQSKGALKGMADAEGYATFVIPDDVGGRYSVLTPVGLLPIAAAGYDIAKLLKGAQDAAKVMKSTDWKANLSARYAAARYLLSTQGKTTEVLANFRPELHYVSEWWKQLYGESEGKEGKGLFPASVDLTTDLHSMGQYLQEGQRNLMETMLWVADEDQDVVIPKDKDDREGLNFLAGKKLSWVNEQAFKGTAVAHRDGGLPVIRLTMNELSEYSLGYLYYFFEMACGISGTLLGINPFDQPGVEAYKKNMFALLGKKGFEKLAAELKAKGV